MKTFTIDGMNFSNLEEFYDEISDKLIPDASWGYNLNAFNDILRGGFGTPDEGFVLIWKNSHISRKKLGYDETVIQLEKGLQSCHPDNYEAVSHQLKNAQKGIGQTVFDWLVEIILCHSEGGKESKDNVVLHLLGEINPAEVEDQGKDET